MELVNLPPKSVPMRYKTVTITKVDNGYLLSCVFTQLGTPPRQEDLVFVDFQQVLDFLNPSKLK